MAPRSNPKKTGSGRRPPLPPALERKLRQREQAGGQQQPHAPQQAPRGGPAARIVRHQGR